MKEQPLVAHVMNVLECSTTFLKEYLQHKSHFLTMNYFYPKRYLGIMLWVMSGSS